MKQYFQQGISHWTKEIMLLLAAELFIHVLQKTGSTTAMMNTLYEWSGNVYGLNLVILLPLIVVRQTVYHNNRIRRISY